MGEPEELEHILESQIAQLLAELGVEAPEDSGAMQSNDTQMRFRDAILDMGHHVYDAAIESAEARASAGTAREGARCEAVVAVALTAIAYALVAPDPARKLLEGLEAQTREAVATNAATLRRHILGQCED